MASSPIVERLDVEEKIGSRLLSCVVNGMMDQFAFQSTKEAFHRSVVVIAADAVHAGLNGVLAQQLLINVAGVLAALILVMNKARARLALINSHLQRLLNQGTGHSFRHRPTDNTTARIIAMAARQEQIGIPEISLTPKRKAADLPDLQRRVIEMLPGCGMVAARDLLQHFGDVRRIANATEEELCAVRGIGAVKAAEICRVLNAEYEQVGTERDLEDAIASAPELLFDHPVELIARQHHIYTEAGARHVVDLVFFDATANALILVELKLGALLEEHYHQLRRYLDHVAKSPLVQAYTARGARVRGVLASLEEGGFFPQDDDVTTFIVDRAQTIKVLKGLRKRRLTS